MKVASENSCPSSIISSSPILSFKVTFGVYYMAVRTGAKLWKVWLTW